MYHATAQLPIGRKHVCNRQNMGWGLQANNVIVKKSPHAAREEGGLISHVDLIQLLDIVDLEAGTTVAGNPC